MKEEFIGLSIVEEALIRCGDCNTPLVDLIVTETNEHRIARKLKPINTVFKVGCWKCGGSSFQTKVYSGSVSIGLANDYTDIEHDSDPEIRDNILYCTLNTRKKHG